MDENENGDPSVDATATDESLTPAAAASLSTTPKRRRGQPPGSKNVKPAKNPTTKRTASGLKRAGSQKKPHRFATASFLGRHPSSSSDPIFSTPKTKGKVYSRKRKRDSVATAEYVYPGVDFSPAADGDDDQQAELRGTEKKKKKAERGQGGMRISSAAIARDSSDETDESTSDVKAIPPMPESEVDSVFAVVDKILYNQVDFLVKQAGLSENFRQVVTKIWFRYGELLGVFLWEIFHRRSLMLDILVKSINQIDQFNIEFICLPIKQSINPSINRQLSCGAVD